MEISDNKISTTELMHFPVEERFIKLPINNYLNILEIEPIPPQIALINLLNSPKYRFITAALSRRTGKTFISNIIGQLVTLIPNSNILIMSPNYSLSQISFDLQKNLLERFEIELKKCNNKDRIIEIINGSTIRMGSIAQANSVVGRSYDLIIFDEAALDSGGKEVFNVQLRPTLDLLNEIGNSKSKAIFISTPRGKNWFYEFFRRGFDPSYEMWASIKSTYKDNPRVLMKDILEAKRSLSHAEFGQEYECDFIALQGQIYKLDQEQIVEIDVNTINKWDVIGGLDLGFKDETALVIIITDGENFYVVDEYFESGKSTSQHAKEIQEKIDKWGIDFLYIDSAAAQTKYDLAYDYGITCINAKKSILDGIGYVSSIIDHNRLFIDVNCTNLILSLDNYKWDDREGLIKEKPVHDIYSHLADALRYALYSHSYNVSAIGEI